MITVGYGDISPRNENEMILCIVTMLFACGVFAYAVNQIGNIIQDFFRSDKQIKEKIYIINKYMSKKSIDQDLQLQIRKYLEYYWQETNEEQEDCEEKIINQLSDSLREELFYQANKIVLKDSKIFSESFSPAVVKKTIPLIKEMRCAPE